MRGAGPPSSWGHHRDEPSPHPTSSILSIAAPAPHFYWEGEAGSAGKISTGKKKQTVSLRFFFSLLWQNKTAWPDGQTDRHTAFCAQQSSQQRFPCRFSCTPWLIVQLSLKRICGQSTLLLQQKQENNFRIKPPGTIKNEKKTTQLKASTLNLKGRCRASSCRCSFAQIWGLGQTRAHLLIPMDALHSILLGHWSPWDLLGVLPQGFSLVLRFQALLPWL